VVASVAKWRPFTEKYAGRRQPRNADAKWKANEENRAIYESDRQAQCGQQQQIMKKHLITLLIAGGVVLAFTSQAALTLGFTPDSGGYLQFNAGTISSSPSFEFVAGAAQKASGPHPASPGGFWDITTPKGTSSSGFQGSFGVASQGPPPVSPAFSYGPISSPKSAGQNGVDSAAVNTSTSLEITDSLGGYITAILTWGSIETGPGNHGDITANLTFNHTYNLASGEKAGNSDLLALLSAGKAILNVSFTPGSGVNLYALSTKTTKNISYSGSITAVPEAGTGLAGAGALGLVLFLLGIGVVGNRSGAIRIAKVLSILTIGLTFIAATTQAAIVGIENDDGATIEFDPSAAGSGHLANPGTVQLNNGNYGDQFTVQDPATSINIGWGSISGGPWKLGKINTSAEGVQTASVSGGGTITIYDWSNPSYTLSGTVTWNNVETVPGGSGAINYLAQANVVFSQCSSGINPTLNALYSTLAGHGAVVLNFQFTQLPNNTLTALTTPDPAAPYQNTFNGSITAVPEASTVTAGLGALGFLLVLGVRSRRSRLGLPSSK
jgi:hypothetical protein